MKKRSTLAAPIAGSQPVKIEQLQQPNVQGNPRKRVRVLERLASMASASNLLAKRVKLLIRRQ